MELKFNKSSSNSKEKEFYDNYKYVTQKKGKNEFQNKLMQYKSISKSDSENSDQNRMDENNSLAFDDKINFYEVQKNNIINYMTPIKVNNKKQNKTKKDNIINNYNENDELSYLFSNSDTDNKKVMISELDIELSDSNSNSNYFIEYKNIKNHTSLNSENKSNNINLYKKREIEFKKEIEENIKIFLKKNQEKNTNKSNNISNIHDKNFIFKKIINKEKQKYINIKNNIKMKRLKKQSHIANYCCLTENNNNKKNKFNNSIKINQKKISNFMAIKNKLKFDNPNQNHSYYIKFQNNNNSFKNQRELISKNSANKKYNDIIKLNMSKKINNNKTIQNNDYKKKRKFNLSKKKQKQMNFTNINEIKSRIFDLQNKIKKTILVNNKNNDLNEYNVTNKNRNKKNDLNNFGINGINNTYDEYYIKNEKRKKTSNNSKKKKIDLLTKNENSQKSFREKIISKINDKNIILQNLNFIDYNNINININNNIINKSYKLSKARNTSKKKMSIKKNTIKSININNNHSNFKKNTMNNNTSFKRAKLIEIKNLCDSYIKNSYKNNTSLNNSKFLMEKKGIFQRMHNEKKLTYKENLDIKNKILHYYLNKKDIDKNKTKYIKVNDIECRKNYNTISNNLTNNLTINEETLSSNKKEKEKLMKQKTFKRIENINNTSNIFNNGKKKFIRPRKEKRNTQICSNNIKKNLFEFKFIHFK